MTHVCRVRPTQSQGGARTPPPRPPPPAVAVTQLPSTLSSVSLFDRFLNPAPPVTHKDVVEDFFAFSLNNEFSSF